MDQYSLWLHFVAVAAGLGGLLFGADRFVYGAGALAHNLKISPLIIGLTVVSMGTSFPELLVTVTASLTGHPDMGIGNVIGSNIANIGLILGLTALVRPVEIHSGFLYREYRLLLIATCVAWLLAINGSISRLDGLLLVGGMVAFLLWTVNTAHQQARAYDLQLDATPLPIHAVSLRASLLQLSVGLLMLLVASRLLVWGGVGIARTFGVDELVIGLTLVAVGTSLPELATTLAGSIRKEDEIAIGNVVGSNIFNTLGILGIPAIIHPMPAAPEALHRDFPIMLLATAALWPICRSWKKGQGRVNRGEGLGLLAGYFLYLYILLF